MNTISPRGYSAIGLDNPKCNHNVGSVLRAAGVYGSSVVITSGQRYKPACTDTMKAWRRMPLINGVNDLKTHIPHGAIPVAIDLVDDAQSLITFKHPERAFYIFGAEDATLGKRVLSWCRDVVYVPTDRCMNLAATVNVVLYDRLAKDHLKHND